MIYPYPNLQLYFGLGFDIFSIQQQKKFKPVRADIREMLYRARKAKKETHSPGSSQIPKAPAVRLDSMGEIRFSRNG